MLRCLAPAKLNLSLRILGERADGYHELETLFERVDLADELTCEPTPGLLSLTCDDPTLPVHEDNLILRAARLLRETGRTEQGARIHLRKRIPIAAGLGGGSSDAAATLLTLNTLWRLELELLELLDLGAMLGSDVPFFIHQRAFAIGRGRGDICEPLPLTDRLAHVLVVPPIRLSAKEVYEGLRESRSRDPSRHPGGHGLRPCPTDDHTAPVGGMSPHAGGGAGVGGSARGAPQFGLTAPHASISMLVHALSNGSLVELAKGLGNDLEPEAIRRCPISGLIQSQLREQQCLGALVSGSGPSVFGLCRDLTQARTVAAALRVQVEPSCRIEVVQTLHPRGSRVLNPA